MIPASSFTVSKRTKYRAAEIYPILPLTQSVIETFAGLKADLQIVDEEPRHGKACRREEHPRLGGPVAGDRLKEAYDISKVPCEERREADEKAIAARGPN